MENKINIIIIKRTIVANVMLIICYYKSKDNLWAGEQPSAKNIPYHTAQITDCSVIITSVLLLCYCMLNVDVNKCLLKKALFWPRFWEQINPSRRRTQNPPINKQHHHYIEILMLQLQINSSQKENMVQISSSSCHLQFCEWSKCWVRARSCQGSSIHECQTQSLFLMTGDRK